MDPHEIEELKQKLRKDKELSYERYLESVKKKKEVRKSQRRKSKENSQLEASLMKRKKIEQDKNNCNTPIIFNIEDVNVVRDLAEAGPSTRPDSPNINIDANDITKAKETLPKNVPELKGITDLQQVNWKTQEDMFQVLLRKFMCFDCPLGDDCIHYDAGKVDFSSAFNKNCQKTNKVELETNVALTLPSINENESSNIRLKVGEWVSVIYDDNWYPGVIKTWQGTKCSFMNRISDNLFVWPHPVDVQTLKMDGILTLISSQPVAMSPTTFSLTDEDSSKIEEMFKKYVN